MADSPYVIGGNLPFAAPATNPFVGAGASPQTALAALGPAYQSSYQNALNLNKANYGNILAGYQQAVGGIGGGYDQLSQQVLQGIQGSQAAQSQFIKDAYAQQSGQASQDLINRGLGNTTVQQSVQRGLTLDQQKAQTNLANQFAQLQAGYQAGIGQAGLSARQNLLQNQLGFMERVNSPYPDAGLYSSLAQQYGAASQANKDRQMLAGGGVRGGPPSIGYVSSGGGMPAFRAGNSAGGGMDLAPTGYGYNPALAASAGNVAGAYGGYGAVTAEGKGFYGTLAPSYGATPQQEATGYGDYGQLQATGYPTGGGYAGGGGDENFGLYAEDYDQFA